MKNNQFLALIFLISAVTDSPTKGGEETLWFLFDLALGGYFAWKAIKAGEFK